MAWGVKDLNGEGGSEKHPRNVSKGRLGLVQPGSEGAGQREVAGDSLEERVGLAFPPPGPCLLSVIPPSSLTWPSACFISSMEVGWAIGLEVVFPVELLSRPYAAGLVILPPLI